MLILLRLHEELYCYMWSDLLAQNRQVKFDSTHAPWTNTIFRGRTHMWSQMPRQNPDPSLQYTSIDLYFHMKHVTMVKLNCFCHCMDSKFLWGQLWWSKLCFGIQFSCGSSQRSSFNIKVDSRRHWLRPGMNKGPCEPPEAAITPAYTQSKSSAVTV